MAFARLSQDLSSLPFNGLQPPKPQRTNTILFQRWAFRCLGVKTGPYSAQDFLSHSLPPVLTGNAFHILDYLNVVLKYGTTIPVTGLWSPKSNHPQWSRLSHRISFLIPVRMDLLPSGKGLGQTPPPVLSPSSLLVSTAQPPLWSLPFIFDINFTGCIKINLLHLV